MSGLKLYANILSQPSRALIIFFRAAGIPHDYQEVDLRQGEHLQDEYKSTVNRFGKVPAIQHKDFNLTESISIMKYMTREKNISDHWYPNDSKKRARVDEFLEWQHIGCRVPLSMFFQTKVLIPLISGKPPKEAAIESWKQRMEDALDTIENIWLANNPYLAGDQISIADIIGACEIEQPKMAGYEPREGRPKLSAWLERVRKDLHPHYDDAHVVLNKVAKKYKGTIPSLSKL